MSQLYCEVYDLEPVTDFIIDPVNQVMIEVIPTDDEIVPDKNELQYYGSDFGERLIFQTVGYQKQGVLFIEAAIRWYAAELLDYPDMEFFKNPK